MCNVRVTYVDCEDYYFCNDYIIGDVFVMSTDVICIVLWFEVPFGNYEPI